MQCRRRFIDTVMTPCPGTAQAAPKVPPAATARKLQPLAHAKCSSAMDFLRAVHLKVFERPAKPGGSATSVRRRLLPSLLLAGLILFGPSPAAWAEGHGGYTPNPDTAADRRDLQMGTGGRHGAPFIGQDPVTGDQVMETAPRPPVDQPAHNATIEIKEVKPVIIWRGK